MTRQYSFVRSDVTFESEGTTCAAWLYRPDGVENPPIVVLAHGFAAFRELRLDAYGTRFAEAGYAALVFDYRHWGGKRRLSATDSRHQETASRLAGGNLIREESRWSRLGANGGVGVVFRWRTRP